MPCWKTRRLVTGCQIRSVRLALCRTKQEEFTNLLPLCASSRPNKRPF